MAIRRAVGALRVRFPVEDRVWVIGETEGLSAEGRRFWVVRERLIALANGGRLAPVVAGFAPRGVTVEAAIGGPRTGSVRKAWRFGLEAPRGRLWIGPPDAPREGGWIELPPGRWSADVELEGVGAYRVRLAPADRLGLPLRGVPQLGREAELWDRDVTRGEAVEALLEGAVRAQAGPQAAFEAWVGRHDRYEVDLEGGELVLSLAGKVGFSGEFHAIGSLGDGGGWRWAWANPSLQADRSARSRRVRELGVARDMEWLVRAEIGVPAADVRRLVALATRAMGLGGFYAAPYERGVLYLALAGPRRGGASS